MNFVLLLSESYLERGCVHNCVLYTFTTKPVFTSKTIQITYQNTKLMRWMRCNFSLVTQSTVGFGSIVPVIHHI